MTPALTHRLAVSADIESLQALIAAAMRELLPAFLPPAAVAASCEIMGLDTQLIADGTYFVVERGGVPAGCGGWSRRATRFGGNHSRGRDDRWLDPKTEAARVRAMYTAPACTRQGVGRLVLQLCEQAARSDGFTRTELMATLAGEPLYRACGYEEIERWNAETTGGVPVPLVRMGKRL